MDVLYIVVPCYNEEEVLPLTIPEFKKTIADLVTKGKISPLSRILFVNDGSKDKTWEILEKEHQEDEKVLALKLARNAGHQNALLAGLSVAKEKADIMVTIDADLQDDITKVEDMVDAYHNGCQIVYGVRDNRKSDSFFKRFTAQGFYKFMNRMGVETIYNHADYRLMSKIAVEELSKYTEVNVFLRGMVPLLGYKTSCVYYSRSKREAGESKYPLKKMLSFAFDGITSFSIKPINMIVGLGIFVLFVCILAAVYAFISYFTGNTDSGWTSLILSIWFIGGIQLLSIGVIGQYIGKIYKEVKRRPKYNIETVLDDNNKNN
ncbi:MAG TPA: glycosyltransferase [Lachnospiraceae bacterium]|nr:glycosyltransferase [Lachnospiraceae bacterium]